MVIDSYVLRTWGTQSSIVLLLRVININRCLLWGLNSHSPCFLRFPAVGYLLFACSPVLRMHSAASTAIMMESASPVSKDGTIDSVYNVVFNKQCSFSAHNRYRSRLW
jgi:hypothetical protein